MLKIRENMGTELLWYTFPRSISILNQALKTEILQNADDRREKRKFLDAAFLLQKKPWTGSWDGLAKDWKSLQGGSLPLLSTPQRCGKKTEWIRENRHFFYPHACEVLLAAHLPSKQDGRVRDPSHALIRSSMVEHPAVNRGVEGSRPSGPAYASVAQRRQQLTVNQPQRNTGGSSPLRRTYLLPRTNNRVTALSRRR